MAIAKVLRTITKPQKLCEFVEQFVTTYRELLAEAMTAFFKQDLEEGQEPPDALAFVDGLLRRLRGAYQELLEAEEKHLNERANDGTFRKLRDDAVTALREVTLDMRRIFRVAYGEEKTEEFGFERGIDPQPLPLLRQTQRILGNLRDPDMPLPEPRYPNIGEAERESVVGHLEPLYHKLREAMNNLTHEEAKAQGTQVDKDQALAGFNRTYSLFVNILESAFELAGHRELAGRLRRTLPRRSSPAGEEAEAPSPDTGGDEVEDDGDFDPSGD